MFKKADKDGLVRHSILLFAATQVANVCNLLFHVVMGRGLPDSEYSILSTLLNIMLIIGTPLEAVRTAGAHFAARVQLAGDAGAVKAMVRMWSARLLVPSVITALAGCAGATWIACFFHIETTTPVIIMSLTIPGIVLIPLLAGVLQGLQSFLWMAVAMQALSTVRLIAGAALLWTFLPSALAGLSSQWLGVYLAIATGVWGIWRSTRGAGPAVTPVEGVGSYMMKSFVVLASFATLMNADIIMVRHFLPEVSGSFAQAATISRSIIFLPMPIALAMFPKVVSTGGLTVDTRRVLFRAMAMVIFLIGSGAIVASLIPWLPLKIMYRETSPEAEALVRRVIWAMSPLGLAYLLMNFELAQHRFKASVPLLLCALAYVGGAALFHQRVEQIVGVLAVVSTLAILSLAAGMTWRVRAAPGA